MDTLATIPEYRFETTIDRQSRPFSFCSEGRGETRRSGEEKEKENNKHTRARVIKWPELILLFFRFSAYFFFLAFYLFTHPLCPSARAPLFFAGQSRRRGGNALWAQRVIARRADRARG